MTEKTIKAKPYRPILPAKAGYVERDGKYIPTEETQRRLDTEAALRRAEEKLCDIENNVQEELRQAKAELRDAVQNEKGRINA